MPLSCQDGDRAACFAADVAASDLPKAARFAEFAVPQTGDAALAALAGNLPTDQPSMVVLDEIAYLAGGPGTSGRVTIMPTVVLNEPWCYHSARRQLFSRLWPGRDDPFSARINAVPPAAVLAWQDAPRRLTVVLLRTTTYNSVMASMTVSEARAALPELLSRVEGGEEITITRHGRPAAVLVRPDALRSRRADAVLEDAGRIHELLTQAAAEALPEGRGLTAQRAEELIAAIRAGRDTR